MEARRVRRKINLQRFWSKVDKSAENGCWLWKASTGDHGYGFFGDGLAHRISYELCNGPIPAELCVLHKCDVRACVNPDHLFLGTRTENNLDRLNKGRSAYGEGIRNHKLSNSDILKIRSLYSDGNISQVALAQQFGVTQ